ncbi:MAG TPA: phage integrase SAM-like domain-containing protein [Salinimicrobium sp.]|nr:phage integrase SAM-like domain-containing protein [Salinimicrobium sp.]
MSSISLKLREAINNEQSIYLYFNYGRKKQYRYATGFKIKNKKNWNQKSQQVKNVTDEPKSLHINSELNKLIAFSTALLEQFEREKVNISNALIKKHLTDFKNPHKNTTTDKQKLIIPFYEWFIEYYSINPRPVSNKPLAKSTLRVHKNSLEILRSYQKKKGSISFQDITLDFHHNFVEHLRQQDLSNNYIGTQVKNIKTIMNDAFERDFHQNLDYKKSSFSVLKETVAHIYLTEEELKRMEDLDLSQEPRYDIARDLFLIGAFTGLRVSDYTKLKDDNLQENDGIKYFEVKTQKTGKTVTIPLHPVVNRILKKRNGKLPRKLPEQHINKMIKQIGLMAKINEEIQFERTHGGEKRLITSKKYKQIANHTGRRSFCTNAYHSKMPVIDIMAISGHSSEKVFYNYLKVTPIERLKILADHQFFK